MVHILGACQTAPLRSRLRKRFRAGRVGGDRSALASSNRTCGFPASGSPEQVVSGMHRRLRRAPVAQHQPKSLDVRIPAHALRRAIRPLTAPLQVAGSDGRVRTSQSRQRPRADTRNRSSWPSLPDADSASPVTAATGCDSDSYRSGSATSPAPDPPASTTGASSDIRSNVTTLRSAMRCRTHASKRS
jgi:hypothetical protein